VVCTLVNPEVCSQRNPTDEKQECVDSVSDDHKHWRNRKVFLYRCSDKIDEREHAEDRDEDHIVDDGGIALASLRDYVPVNRKYEEGKEELETPEGQVDNGRHCPLLRNYRRDQGCSA